MNVKILAVAMASLFAVGCEEFEWGNFDRYKEDFQYSYDVNPGVRLYLENMNGSVELTGWERNAIQITGTKHASTESALKALKVDIVANPESVRIRTTPPSGHRGGYGARYVIRLPRKALLEQIASSNGSIRVEDIEGTARLKSSNGGMKVYRFVGPVEMRTSNAGVEVADVRGAVIIQTSNGGVRADSVKGPFEATTSNAGMNVNLSDPEPQRPIKLQTSNGGVELSLGSFHDNDVRISTSNSGITLRLPGSARGFLKAQTSNSNVSTDFDVTVKAGEVRKSYLEGAIGNGPAMFDLTTSNGGIRIVRM